MTFKLGERPKGLSELVYIHPLALVESVEIGEGTKIWGFAHVMSGAKIGRECKLGERVFVEAGAVVGNRVTVKNGICIWDQVTIQDEVFLGPQMVFTNDLRPRAAYKKPREALTPTTVLKGATIGAGAVIVCGITIGEYAFIAAGTVLTKDVPAFALVQGNPGRVVASVCRCANTTFRNGSPNRCPKCGTDQPKF